jgi:hypothetical protein
MRPKRLADEDRARSYAKRSSECTTNTRTPDAEETIDDERQKVRTSQAKT